MTSARERSPRAGVGPRSVVPRDDLKSLRHQAFERVLAAGRLSRTEIARQLGVSPASVGAVVSDLIRAGYLEESDSARVGDAVRGRPRVALAVRPGVGFVAGLKLSDASHSAVVHDFAGHPLADATVTHREGVMSLSDVLDQCERLLDAVLAQARVGRQDLLAVGLGVPGFVDGDGGVVHWSPLIEGGQVPLRDALAARLGLRVAIDNDANLVTLAELWFGDGRGLSDFAVVTIEHGVGMGLVVGNRLYRGARGLGTELGHIKVQLDGALCRCGQRGCLEAYVADYALVREASAALGQPRTDLSQAALLERLHQQARSGNPAAQAIFRRAGRYLAVGLGNVINLFDPGLILLSGERMRYGSLYADEVLAEVADIAIRAGRPAPRIEIHAWGDMIWARGAAALALSETTAARLATLPPERAAE